MSFQDVLGSKKEEDIYEISDLQADNFASFRYQMSTIFRRHHFTEDDDKFKEFYGGLHPLSRFKGDQIKDLAPDLKKQCLEMYKPPGIIVEKESSLGEIGFKSQIKLI